MEHRKEIKPQMLRRGRVRGELNQLHIVGGRQFYFSILIQQEGPILPVGGDEDGL